MTDLLLAAVAGWFAWSLRSALPTNAHAALWLSRALGLTALSGLIGGLYHAYAEDFPPALASSWWFVTLLVVCAVSLAMDFGLVHVAVPAARRRHWSVAVSLKFVAFGIVAIMHPVFLVAIIDYGLSLMAWTVAALVLRRPWRGWMLVGIGLSIVAAVVQQMDWEILAHFNYNDLYHVIQAVALYGFYRAARGLSP
ncbi:MAG: hypothetical protein GEV13_00610 [Rhodospirillales bacterium]|nr:hypothetical protein [Rhodospirillales bacterium]